MYTHVDLPVGNQLPVELLHGVATILDVLKQVLREHGRLFPLQQVGQMSSEKLGLVIGELAEHLVNRRHLW